MGMYLPQWARKPKHRKEVVATPRGWMVKETGEYLKLIKNLDERLKLLKVELDQSLDALAVVETKDVEVEETAIEAEDVVVVEEEEKEETPKKRRGRPRKTSDKKAE